MPADPKHVTISVDALVSYTMQKTPTRTEIVFSAVGKDLERFKAGDMVTVEAPGGAPPNPPIEAQSASWRVDSRGVWYVDAHLLHEEPPPGSLIELRTVDPSAPSAPMCVSHLGGPGFLLKPSQRAMLDALEADPGLLAAHFGPPTDSPFVVTHETHETEWVTTDNDVLVVEDIDGSEIRIPITGPTTLASGPSAYPYWDDPEDPEPT